MNDPHARAVLDWRDEMHRTNVERRARYKLDLWLSQVKYHRDTCVCTFCCDLNDFIRGVS